MENLYTQNLALVKRQDAQIQNTRNQKAFLDKLNENRRAITDGLEKVEDATRRGDLIYLPGPDLGPPENITQIMLTSREGDEDEKEEKGDATQRFTADENQFFRRKTFCSTFKIVRIYK